MKFVLVLITLTLVVACESTLPRSSDNSIGKDGAAVVFGQGGGAAGFIKSLVIPIGVQKDIYISSLNGGAVENRGENSQREYWINDGVHLLSVRCSIQVGGVIIRGRGEIKADLVANKQYVLDAKIGHEEGEFGVIGKVETCIPYLRDKSDSVNT